MYNNNTLLAHLTEFVGQTVTIFTTSGGASGCGFTGVLLYVNPCYVRLVNRQGTPPANPLAKNICGCRDKTHEGTPEAYPVYTIGSVCDIPVDKIASFCHNAV